MTSELTQPKKILLQAIDSLKKTNASNGIAPSTDWEFCVKVGVHPGNMPHIRRGERWFTKEQLVKIGTTYPELKELTEAN